MNRVFYVAGIPVSGDYLMHYRTPGSKNGVRKYQNEDGSLTPLGRIHYGIGQGGMRAQTDSGSQQTVNRASNQIGGNVPRTKLMSFNRLTDPDDKVSDAARKAYVNEYAKQTGDPMASLPDFAKPGHSYREISEEEYNELMSANETSKKKASDILSGLATATPLSVQTAVAQGKTKVKKLKKKKVRVISTSAARTLNEKTKNLTDLSDQKYLRNYFK